MTLSELIRMLGDFVEVAMTILLAYVAYKVAVLVDALNNKLKREG
ncbi:MAG: hypothetical protein QXX51_03160 [Candidatus Bathyarchaeia archaeon]